MSAGTNESGLPGRSREPETDRSGAESTVGGESSRRTGVGDADRTEADPGSGAGGDVGGTADRSDGVEPTDTFEALSNRRRRYALHYLGREDETAVEVRTLAEHVAAWEYGKTVPELDRSERKRVRTALHQFHLPKLDDHGFVEYDDSRGEVCLDGSPPELNVYPGLVAGRSVRWGPYYACLSGLGAALLLAAGFGGPLVGAVPIGLLTALVVGSVLVSGLVHTWYESRRRLGVGEEPPELRE